MMNKKGETSTITITIAIVIGVLILVFMVFGLSTNWKFFGQNTNPLTGDSNIDTLKQACQVHCEAGREYEFCSVKRTVEYKDAENQEASCNEAPINAECSKFTCPNP